jgi:AcrR family transcriptional regulator
MRAGRRTLGEADIVDAALELLAEVGVERLSMRLLSARLDVAVGATYRHVPSKEGLLERCALRIHQNVAESVPRDGRDPLTWVRDVILKLQDVLAGYPGMAPYLLTHASPVPHELDSAVLDALLAAGLSDGEADAARQVLFFYSAGVMLTDYQRMLSSAGISDPRSALTAGLELILRGARGADTHPSKGGPPRQWPRAVT